MLNRAMDGDRLEAEKRSAVKMYLFHHGIDETQAEAMAVDILERVRECEIEEFEREHIASLETKYSEEYGERPF